MLTIMHWWGKILGTVFGYLLGDWVGAVIGFLLGHNLDRGLRRDVPSPGPGRARRGFQAGPAGRENVARAQRTFFNATFAVMGHVAKADGRVSEQEIEVARAVMDRMRLSEDRRRAARERFREGKRPDFPLDTVLDELVWACSRQPSLLRMFLDVQLQAAYADGSIEPSVRALLLRLCHRLGVPEREFERMEAMARSDGTGGAGWGGDPAGNVRVGTLVEAYRVLGVQEGASDAEIKRAYRRLMNQHHPDKLVARGLSEEMLRVASERTQQIRNAYERIRKARAA